MLAHRQHHHLLGAAGIGADGLAVQGGHLRHQLGEMRLDGEIGEADHGGHDFVQVGLAVEIAPDDGADEQVAQPAHGPGCRQDRAIGTRGGLGLQRCAEIEGGQR